jgi:hypothetical protein
MTQFWLGPIVPRWTHALQQQHYHSQLLLYSIWAEKIISGKIVSMLKSECIIGREDL